MASEVGSLNVRIGANVDDFTRKILRIADELGIFERKVAETANRVDAATAKLAGDPVRVRFSADSRELHAGLERASAEVKAFQRATQAAVSASLGGGAPEQLQGAQAAPGMSWREFNKANMAEFMRTEGSHAAAMKRMGAEWAKYKETAASASAGAAQAVRTNLSTLGNQPLIPPGVQQRLVADLSFAARQAGTAAAGEIWRSLESVGDSLSSLGGKLTLGLTAPLALAGGFAVKEAVEVDSLRRGLIGVAGSGAEAATQMERLRTLALRPGIDFKTAVQGSLRLQAVGFQAQFAERMLRGLANAATLSGMGADQLREVVRQMSQVAGTGGLMGDELKVMQENIPALTLALQAAFGTTSAEQIRNLNLPLTELFRRLAEGVETLLQVESSARTTFENFRQSVQMAAAAVGDQMLPLLGELAEMAGESLSELERMSPEMLRWGIAGGAAAAGLGPAINAAGNLTTAIGVLAIASESKLAPLFVKGGVVTVALGVLAAMFVKAKLDAAAARAEIERMASAARDAVSNLDLQAAQTRRAATESEYARRQMLQYQYDLARQRMLAPGADMGEIRKAGAEMRRLKAQLDGLRPQAALEGELQGLSQRIKDLQAPTGLTAQGMETLEQVTGRYETAVARLRAQLAAGTLTQAQFEAKSKGAAQTYNRELLALLGSLRAAKKLTPELEQEIGKALQLDPDKGAARRVEEIESALERLQERAERLQALRGLGVADVVAMPEGLREAANEAERLRRELQQAEADLAAVGSRAPAGAVEAVRALRQEYETARGEAQRLASEWNAAWDRAMSRPIAPRLAGATPQLIDLRPSFEAVMRQAQEKSGKLREDLARGIISPEEFERKGREAAQALNRGLLSVLDYLRDASKLTPEIEAKIRAELQLDLDKGGSLKQFNETLEAIRNVTSGVGELGEALGGLSPALSGALRGVEGLIGGVGRIRAGGAAGGTLGAMSMMSGALGVLGGAVSVLTSLFGRQDETVRRNTEALDKVRQSFDTFSGTRGAMTDVLQAIDAFQAKFPDTFAWIDATKGTSLEKLFGPVAKQFGVTFDELKAIADRYGIDLAEKGLNTRTLKQLEEILRTVTDRLFEFGRGLEDQARRLDARREIFDLTEPADVLADQYALLGRFAPELMKAFGLENLDLSTDAGRKALEEGLRRIFEAYEAGTIKDLLGGFESGQQFIDTISGVDRALDGMTDSVNKAAGALTNMPEIFDYALRRRMAAIAGAVPTLPGGGDIRMPDYEPRPSTPGGGGRGVEFNVTINHPPAGADGRTLAAEVKRELVRSIRQSAGADELVVTLQEYV